MSGPRPPPTNSAELRLAATEPRETLRALALDQGVERKADERRLLLRPSEPLSFGNLLVVECDGRAHPAILGTVCRIK